LVLPGIYKGWQVLDGVGNLPVPADNGLAYIILKKLRPFQGAHFAACDQRNCNCDTLGFVVAQTGQTGQVV
jgi:hypothetical protein